MDWRDGRLTGLDPGDNTSVYLQPRYFAIRQFTRYVQPGHVRVDATETGGNVVTSGSALTMD